MRRVKANEITLIVDGVPMPNPAQAIPMELNFVPKWQQDLEASAEYQALTPEEQGTVVEYERKLREAEGLDAFLKSFRNVNVNAPDEKEAIEIFKRLQKAQR